MFKKLIISSLAVILVLAAGSVWATEYYVRPDGNDGNTGLANDAANAWLTIQHGAETAKRSTPGQCAL